MEERRAPRGELGGGVGLGVGGRGRRKGQSVPRDPRDLGILKDRGSGETAGASITQQPPAPSKPEGTSDQWTAGVAEWYHG